MNTVGKNIRALRQQKGWSQIEIAKRIHISIPAVSKIESGNTDVNLSRVAQIAEIFGVRTQDILTKPDEAAKNQNSLQVLDLQEKIKAREADIITLQIKLIELYEEARK